LLLKSYRPKSKCLVIRNWRMWRKVISFNYNEEASSYVTNHTAKQGKKVFRCFGKLHSQLLGIEDRKYSSQALPEYLFKSLHFCVKA
jgi:hypothetical protein